MSTACGRPQGGRGPAHVDRGGGSKTWSFCGRHKWMAPSESDAEAAHSKQVTYLFIMLKISLY